jgi:type II secretory pathway pseudopilin PulG
MMRSLSMIATATQRGGLEGPFRAQGASRRGKRPLPAIAGLSLVEMMIAIVVLSLVSIGVIGYYQSLRRAATTQELSTSVEDNLRLGLDILASSLRGAKYGVPSSGLSTWVDWVAGFTANPQLTEGPSGTPDTLTVASCTPMQVAELAADADADADLTTLTLEDSHAPINDSNRSLIYIGDEESARITAVTGAQITIDTDLSTAGNQGLTRNYKVGTPICRVDVVTYSVSIPAGQPTGRLIRNDNQGNAMPVADNIIDLQITQVTGGIKPAYRITLTGRSSRKDPSTGSVVTRSLSTTVSPRN